MRRKTKLTEDGTSPDTISLEDWSRLYQVANEFKTHKPWIWMENEDVFGVQNPLTREIGYCCIMGTIGAVYGLGVYLGSEGIETLRKILSGAISQKNYNSVEALMAQKCLMASFEEKRYLYQEDLDIIKKLGLKFRGDNGWPLFRSYEPGYFPWYLTVQETRFLTIALEQALEVSLRAQKDKSFLVPKPQSRYLVRVPPKDDTTWSDQYLMPIKETPGPVQPVQINEIRLQHIKHNSRQISSIWEIDRFYLPEPVRGSSGRPYFPHVVLFVDQELDKILGFKLAEPTKSQMIGEYFLDLVEQTKVFPQEIHVTKSEVFDLLSPVTSKLDIPLKMLRQFKVLENARNSLSQFMQENDKSGQIENHQHQNKTKRETITEGSKQCGLCGKRGKLTKTPCCGNWICDDSDQYVFFSYAHNSCYRNHDHYTMCAVHYHEGT